ncbi:efflux RND transporter periplasmic adaptor subunit [Priestia filamentosa]|uniref:HlyD family secretion protein n=1 Tax=Priestia filamentosa TaxID=1402861 RepID=UPI003981AAC8
MNFKKLVVINVATLAVLGAAGVGGFHYYDQVTNYVKTDNAKIDGKQYIITAPAAGKLTDWDGSLGKEFAPNSSLGKITIPASEEGSQSKTVDITSPTDLTIVSDKALDNTLVSPTTPLAYAYDFNDLYVTANFEETKIDEIKLGQEVDLYVDAFGDQTLKGTVSEIGLATASEFSLVSSGNSDANYTKVTQVIPVKITINDHQGVNLVPGMNVTVKVHK